MKLESNRNASSSKRTRHCDIKLLYVTDLIGRNEVIIKYYPIDDMIADYTTKPLIGFMVRKFRDLILNLSDISHRIGQQEECVG